jgi:hypothetical protein
MAFVKHLAPVEREVPHEPGHYFSFRRLSADEVDATKAAVIKEAAAMFDADSVAILKQLQDPDDEETKKATAMARAQQASNPLSGFSARTLVEFGVVGWRGVKYPDFAEELKTEIDSETREWAALAVIEVSVISVGEAPSSLNGSAPARELIEATATPTTAES